MKLKPYEEMEYHPLSEQIVGIIREQVQNTKSDSFFRTVTSFYFAQMASAMRTKVKTADRGVIPVNLYACCLMESGAGKGHSQSILEDSIVNEFRKVFTKETYPMIADQNLEDEALYNAQLKGTEFEAELGLLKTEFSSGGPLPFAFSEGSAPAYKQIRGVAQMAKIGSVNYIVDEIGSNLANGQDLWKVCLEVYDLGKVKDKITKASSDNKRYVQREDPVPSNMLAFGTQTSLLDGGATEKDFISFLLTGYGRRFMFGTGNQGTEEVFTAEELYDRLCQSTSSLDLEHLSKMFGRLADASNYDQTITMEKDESIALIQYKMDCEEAAEKISSFDPISRAEIKHRYFRVLKLAGAYAFVDSTATISMDQLYNAIKVVEDSGRAFYEIMNQPKNYSRLAHYLASANTESTLADLAEALPFFPSAKNKQEELISLAIAWGYRNNVIIRRNLMDGIEFFSGESLQETDLDKMVLSYVYSTTEAGANHGYTNIELKWKQLSQLCQKPDYHWVNHHLNDGHRSDEDTQIGTNLLVLDVDGGTTLAAAKTALEGYAMYIYTTKRHTPTENRFRIILPSKYKLKLHKMDYKEFMTNVRDTIPFETDDASNQISKKWLCHQGHGEYIEGDMFDPLPFIPKTKKNAQRQKDNKALANMDRVEMYFAKLWEAGRNKTLLRYGTMLLDSGLDLYATTAQVKAYNKKFSDPLTDAELNNTVFVTLGKKSTVTP